MVLLEVRQKSVRFISLLIFIVVTLLAPNNVYPLSLLGEFHSHQVNVCIAALLWMYLPYSVVYEDAFNLINITILPLLFALSFFNILFAFQVVNLRTKEALPWITGILTLVPGVIAMLLVQQELLRSSILVYIGPIPIQFIVGMIVAKIIKQPEPLDIWAESSDTQNTEV